jgi:uncharacterized SAM-binding protein YcdF (DUF218 family)
MKKKKKRSDERGGAVTSLVALACVAALCAVVFLARHPILRFAAESWVVDEPAEHADALVVLGDDNFYADRATHAAQLFREGVAPTVVASGRRLRPNAGISELMEHDLVERGVPKEKIVRLSHDSDSTKEEAAAVTKFAEEKRWKSIVVVTSNYHTRRARYIFSRVVPAGITVRVVSARDGSFDPERWWEKRESVKLFVRELAGMVVAVWELRGPEKQSAHASMRGRESGLKFNGVDDKGTINEQKASLPFTSCKCCNMFKILSRDPSSQPMRL